MNAVQESLERVGEKMDILPTRNGELVSLQQVMQAFYTGPFGEHFQTQMFRYTKRYGLSSAEAIKYLESDAHPIGHQLMLSEIYTPVVLQQSELPVDEDDALLLRFVTAFHDIGESTHEILTELGLTVVGDIPAGEKTEEDRENERLIRGYFWSSPPFSNLDPTFLERGEAIIAHHPKEGDKHLYALFETAHHLQAFDTAMTAHYSVLSFPELREEKTDVLLSLYRLAHDVGISELKELNKWQSVSGHSMPAIDEANRRAGLLHCSHSELFTLVEPPTIVPRHLGNLTTRLCAQTQS